MNELGRTTGSNFTVHPAETFDDLEIVSITMGRFRQNAYVVVHLPSRDALVIDPGAEGEFLIDYLEQRNLKLRRMLLTHGHFDHLGAAAALTTHFGIPSEVDERDRAIVRHAPTYSLRLLGRMTPSPPVEYFTTPAGLLWAGHTIEVSTLSGHTPGSVSYGLPGAIFTGDSLLRAKLGPTEYPESKRSDLVESVSQLIAGAPPITRLLPGHGRPWIAAEAHVWWSQTQPSA